MQSVLRLGFVRGVLIAAVGLLPLQAAHAIDFSVPVFGSDEGVKGVLNTTFTAGVGVRMQSQSPNLIGKGDINPNVCGGPKGAYQICQGLFKDQIYPSQILVAAPGAASVNGDQGDLNYSEVPPVPGAGQGHLRPDPDLEEFRHLCPRPVFLRFRQQRFHRNPPERNHPAELPAGRPPCGAAGRGADPVRPHHLPEQCRRRRQPDRRRGERRAVPGAERPAQ